MASGTMSMRLTVLFPGLAQERAEQRARDWHTATRADRRAVVAAILADEQADVVAADRRFWRTWAFVLALAALLLVAGDAILAAVGAR